MVEKLKQILAVIEKEKGKVIFFGALKMDEVLDKWSILLSAEWSTELTKKDDFSYIRNLLLTTFNSEEISSFARLGILSKDTHLIQLLLQYQSDTEILSETKLNGNIIHEAYIIASNANP